jgi:hypothetical protein
LKLNTFVFFSTEVRREGGGGVIVSAEFAKVGRRAIEILGIGDSALNVQSIIAEIAGTKVIPVEKICYNETNTGVEYCEDAHYDKDKNIIIFAYKNWDKMSCLEKILLSSHEFFRAAGLEGEDYRYSSRFIDGTIVQCGMHDDCADKVMQIGRMLDVFPDFI